MRREVGKRGREGGRWRGEGEGGDEEREWEGERGEARYYLAVISTGLEMDYFSLESPFL